MDKKAEDESSASTTQSATLIIFTQFKPFNKKTKTSEIHIIMLKFTKRRNAVSGKYTGEETFHPYIKYT